MNEENQNAVALNRVAGLDLGALGASNVTDVPVEHPIPAAPPDTGPLKSSTYVWDPARDNADPSLTTAAERQAMGLESAPQAVPQPTPQQMMQMMMQMMGMMQQAVPQAPAPQPQVPPTVTAASSAGWSEPVPMPPVTPPQMMGTMQAPPAGVRVFSVSLHSQNPEGDGVKVNGLMVLTDLLRLTLPGVRVSRNAVMMQIVMPDTEGDLQAARGAIARYDIIGTLGEEQAMRRASRIAEIMPEGAMGAAIVRQFLESWYLGYLEAVV